MELRMSMSSPTILPNAENTSTQRGRWMVIIFNNDHNSVDEVVAILMHATACDLQEAIIETWEADTFGKASVHFSTKPECHRVAKSFRRSA